MVMWYTYNVGQNVVYEVSDSVVYKVVITWVTTWFTTYFISKKKNNMQKILFTILCRYDIYNTIWGYGIVITC